LRLVVVVNILAFDETHLARVRLTQEDDNGLIAIARELEPERTALIVLFRHRPGRRMKSSSPGRCKIGRGCDS